MQAADARDIAVVAKSLKILAALTRPVVVVEVVAGRSELRADVILPGFPVFVDGMDVTAENIPLMMNIDDRPLVDDIAVAMRGVPDPEVRAHSANAGPTAVAFLIIEVLVIVDRIVADRAV